MKRESLFEQPWFVWGLALLGLIVTSVVFPSLTRQESEAAAPQVRKDATPKHQSTKVAPERGMIVIR